MTTTPRPSAWKIRPRPSPHAAVRRAFTAIDNSARSAIVSARAVVFRDARHGRGKFRHGVGKPRRGPLLERHLDEVFAAKMHRRLQAVERERRALFDHRPPAVQLCELALGGEKDRANRSAGNADLRQLRLQIGGPAGKRRIDQIVERKAPRRRRPRRSHRPRRLRRGRGHIAQACGVRYARPPGRRQEAE